MTLIITGKQAGSRVPLFPTWRLPLEETLPNPILLCDLIAFIARSEVEAFRERQEARHLTRVLSTEDIARGITQGRVDAGGRNLNQTVDVAEAIEIALRAFEDGLYFVFADEQQIERLEDYVHLRPETQILFMRLVALAGG